ncbi:TPA: antitoxin [Streptococcus agalactiae]|nr:antitoxin [Streptococcus agalactiae]HEM9214983.1 antitoxin [Streptococcus agalactiae]HEM9215863.1 antitoxin [Streptococcus agalactiae]HEM9328445.1 antitoxin [Streptococcus agalactiae]HEM9329519.1 antitoxin [Streptococcus agalactiae]
MTDEEFSDLVEQKSIGKKLNIHNKEVIEEFFITRILLLK